MKGQLITFEGVEGAGKTTLIKAVARRLGDAGKEVFVTRQPGGTPLGVELRRILLDENIIEAEFSELWLYLADRVEHVETVILPQLESGAIVLCDRFTDSTVAYQGYGRQLHLKDVVAACYIAQRVSVDRTYLLDLDPAVGLARARGSRGKLDRMEREKLEFHRRIRDGFLKLAAEQSDRIQRFDATASADALAADIGTDLMAWLQ